MGHIKTRNHELYYAVRGASGAPLVFIHGAGDSHLMWNGQLAAFAGTARAIALDLPGHGRSAGPGRKTIAEYAAAVREFLDALGLERAILAGSSMGGAIAQVLALESPGRVMGLVLVGTGARLRVAPQFLDGLKSDFESTALRLVEFYYAGSASPYDATSRRSAVSHPRHGASPLLPKIKNGFSEEGSKSEFVHGASPIAERKGDGGFAGAEGKSGFVDRGSTGQVSEVDVLKGKSLRQLLITGAEVTYNDFAACDAFDLRDQVRSISCPTLVVCGCDDKMTPLKYSEFLAQQIPGADLVVLDGAGHMVMLEQPRAFNAILRDWLGRTNL